MFSYVAFAWNAADTEASRAAMHLIQRLQRSPAMWQTAVHRSGLRVFYRGARRSGNTAYVLEPDRGVILGRLFRREDGDEAQWPNVMLSDQEIADVLETRGRTLVSRFWGRYVAFLHDRTADGTCVLRDPSGSLPCFIVRHRRAWIFFSWMEDVIALGVSPPSVNWDYIRVHLPSHVLECRETAIDEVTQVLAGECLQLAGGTATPAVHWNPVHVAASETCEDRIAAAAALVRTVRGCVRSWARAYGNVVHRLSGGVDSSIVATCLAAGAVAAEVACINYFSPGSDSDERNYARLAAAAARRKLIERERDPSIRLERMLDMARTPSPSFYLGRLETGRMDAELAAAHGASAVFTGIGGDQVFHQAPVVWPAADYAHRHGIRPALFRAALEAARVARVSVWAALRAAIKHGLLRDNTAADADVGQYLTLMGPDLIAAARSDTRFLHPALRTARDTPIGKLAHIRSLIFPTEYYDPLGSEDDPERVHPLLSQPIVELCLKIPTYVLIAGGRDRGLARQAFASDLPREIARRRSKGGQEEHVKAILLRNLDFVRAMLLDGALVKHGILDRTKLEEVLSGRPTAIASSVMELHTYLGVEAWLHRWDATRQRAVA